MAYGDFGGLSPSEAYFTGPRGNIDAATNEAVKKGTYLSQMDQFYAQLEEMERQFDVTAQFKEDTLDLSRERFEWEKEYGSSELALRAQDIEMRERVGLAGPRAQRYVADVSRDVAEQELEWKEESSDQFMNFLSAREERLAIDSEQLSKVTPNISGELSLPSVPKTDFDTTINLDWSAYT